MGTHWEQVKNTKNPSPRAPSERKNLDHHECMLSLPIGCMKLTVPHHFSPRLMAGAEFWGHKMTIGFNYSTCPVTI